MKSKEQILTPFEEFNILSNDHTIFIRRSNALIAMDDYAKELRAELDEVKLKLEKEEKTCLQVIDERDVCEEVIGDMYSLITGNDPEWSTHFGYKEAMEDCSNLINSMRSELEAVKKERDELKEKIEGCPLH